MIREAYYFLNIYKKIKDNEDWGHISKLAIYLNEILENWIIESRFSPEILEICQNFIDEYNYSIDLNKDMLTFSEERINRLGFLMVSYMKLKNDEPGTNY